MYQANTECIRLGRNLGLQEAGLGFVEAVLEHQLCIRLHAILSARTMDIIMIIIMRGFDSKNELTSDLSRTDVDLLEVDSVGQYINVVDSD